MKRSFFLGSVLLASCSKPETNEERIIRYQHMDLQEMIREIKTPEQVAWYLQNYIRAEADASMAYTFRDFNERRKGDCSEAVVAAAALLSDDGYPPQVMFFRDPFNVDNSPRHVIFLYQENNQWGSLGINRLDVQKPIFLDLDELAEQFPYKKYAYEELPITMFPEWIYGSGNLNFQKKFFGLSPSFVNIK